MISLILAILSYQPGLLFKVISLSPAVCSFCYHRHKRKYALDEEQEVIMN